jgi:S1-C subfamily serine protease
MLILMRGCQSASVAVQAPEPAPVDVNGLLNMQRAQNKGLEEELAELQALLREDPCSLAEKMGPPLEKAPVAPSYGAPQTRAPESGAPQAEAAPPPPSRNGTAPAPTAAPPPSTVAELMDQATVFVVSAYEDQVGMGSGFFVAPGVIATNRHVAQGPDAQVLVGNKVLGGMQPARIVAFSPDKSRDYALLAVDPDLAAKAPVLQVASGASRTERISAWGFPGYITAIDPKLAAMARGDVKAVPEVVYSEGVVSVVLERTPSAILHTASLSQGNSGGPLINSQGVVVGINTFIRQADQSYSQTNIALVGGDLIKFMQEHGVNPATPGK